jgi:integrase
MPKLKEITDTAAQRLKGPKAGQLDYFDRTYPGLTLRVSHRGVKSWVYLYRLRGKQHRMTFDRYPAMTVAAAHDAWRQARTLVQARQDPAATGRVAALDPDASRTDFAGVTAEWLKRDQAKNRTCKVTEQLFKREVLPRWGHRQITDIGRRDVLDLVDRIADRPSVVMARRTHAKLHRLFAWALGRGIVTVNPLTNLPKPGKEVERERVLTDGELEQVWCGAEKLGWPYGSAFQLLVLTAARRSEIAQLRWSELDDPEKPTTITLKGDRTKNGETHIIPLSTPARALLARQEQHRIAGSDFVFTVSGRLPISAWNHAKQDLDAMVGVKDWRTHDLRRTAATGLQRLGVALEVTEAILGHTAGSRAGIIKVYQRHAYGPEKAAALEAWGAHVIGLVEGRKAGKVLPMRRG